LRLALLMPAQHGSKNFTLPAREPRSVRSLPLQHATEG